MVGHTCKTLDLFMRFIYYCFLQRLASFWDQAAEPKSKLLSFLSIRKYAVTWMLNMDIHLHVHLTSLVHERYNPVASIPEILTVYLYLAL